MSKDRRYILRAGWLVDGSGGPVERRVSVTLQDGVIASVGAGNGAFGGDAALDFSGDTIVPCLVDSHVHLFMSGSGDPDQRIRQLDAGFSEVCGKMQDRIRRHMACGVMAVRDGGDGHGHALRFRQEVLPGRFPGFVLRTAGKAWRNEERYGKLIGRPPKPGKSLAESIAACSPVVDHVKVVNSGLNSLLRFGKTTRPQFSRDELRAAVKAAEAAGLKVMVHANGPQAVEDAVEAGCHSIEHGFFAGKETLQKMADRGVVWVPTAVTMKAYAEGLPPGSREAAGARRNLEHQLEQIRFAREAGVCIAAGSDAGSLHVHHGSGLIEEAKLLTAAGCSTAEAVRCASANGARLLGGDTAGRRLAPGRPASFLVCPGGPDRLFDSLYRLKGVYVGGKKIQKLPASGECFEF